MTRNYELLYYIAENVGIIGILAYPKSTLKSTFNMLITKIMNICSNKIIGKNKIPA